MILFILYIFSEQNIALKYPEKLFVEDYEKDLEMLILTAAPLEFDSESLLLCMKNNDKFKEKLYQELPIFISNTTKYVFFIVPAIVTFLCNSFLFC